MKNVKVMPIAEVRAELRDTGASALVTFLATRHRKPALCAIGALKLRRAGHTVQLSNVAPWVPVIDGVRSDWGDLELAS
jgi:hypothetical protein